MQIIGFSLRVYQAHPLAADRSTNTNMVAKPISKAGNAVPLHNILIGLAPIIINKLFDFPGLVPGYAVRNRFNHTLPFYVNQIGDNVMTEHPRLIACDIYNVVHFLTGKIP